ncbi:MAG: hypothetical protein RJA70_2750 [Pseudomonadota bacterium]
MNDSINGTTHFSTFDLELSLLEGESSLKHRKIAAHLQGCAQCRDAMAELKRLHSEFETSVLPRALLNARSEQPTTNSGLSLLPRTFGSRPTPWHLHPAVWAPALASAAAIVLALGLGSRDTGPTQPAADLQAKGDAQLSTYIHEGGTTRQLPSTGVGARAGDEVRFVLTTTSSRTRYLLLISVESTGKTNVYWPPSGERNSAIRAPGRFEVPGSIVLDDAPGPERVFALLSSLPLETAVVETALAALARNGTDAIRATEVLDLTPTGGSLTEQHSVLLKHGSGARHPE